MRAFQDAADLGYRYLETDVHATADGVLVAFHDDTLDRVTDGRGAVADLGWEQVRKSRIGGSEPIPLLDELLATFPDAHLNIDVKSDAGVAPLIEVLRRPDVVDRVCVGSFQQSRIRAIRRAIGPRLCTAAGPWEVRALKVASFTGPIASATGPVISAAAFQVPEEHEGTRVVDARFVDAAHRIGAEVHVWTVNEESDMARLLDLGVDGIVTDATRTLKGLLERRGAW